MEKLFVLCNQIFNSAVTWDLLDKSPLLGIKLRDYFIYQHGEHGWIESTSDLKLLIRYCYNYPHLKSVKNGLLMGLLTGLRAGNVRHLTIDNLKQDESGGYFLEFENTETKMKRRENLGLPDELAEWLLSIYAENNEYRDFSQYFFPALRGGKLSDGTLKQGASVIPRLKKLIGGDSFVFHSFRKVISTFSYDNISPENPEITPYAIEVLQFHKFGKVQETYNKSSKILQTRQLLNWWLKYINSLVGFNILESKK